MNIGLIDADLLDNGTRHPNIALMKISACQRDRGHDTRLILNYDEMHYFEKVYISKVFSYTTFPPHALEHPNVEYGGTGFFFEKAPDLPDEIEHHMPDYTLYNEYVEREIARGIRPVHFRDYVDYSIGFATRGCYRKCPFCVNQKYDGAFRHAPITEFFDPTRKYIYLWDDNVLAYKGWRDVFDELEETGRRFQFRQGLDMRLMTEEKAAVLTKARYIGDYIFAFDFLKDRALIERKLKVWKRYCQKTTKLYILCAFESQDVNDIIGIFERLAVLMRYRCIPYIMRYESYKDSPFKGLYVNIARWCNQPDFFKKKSFREYCEANGPNSSTMKYFREFERAYPDVAGRYFDLKYETEPMAFDSLDDGAGSPATAAIA